MWRVGECLCCGRRVWGTRRGYYLDAGEAGLLLRLLGAPRTEGEVRPISLYGHRRWLVHASCARLRPQEMEAVFREQRIAALQRDQRVRERAERLRGTELTAGMSQREVVRLLGEPLARMSVGELLARQRSVRFFGGSPGEVELWFFEVLPSPDRVLRIAFGDGRVLGIEEVDRP
ncbi:hypothetical protein DI005_29020 [Prauserella sp. PE36]|uniref:hypothetical protein n=1 Tax=Prauserella sp. PE36 TaxID=1504709 RepID=UPI000DE47BB3|nr:hypothetical protein [Prauserella sp. PE36]RBM14725.1 hypothetical protein DI005_29020 [Prauserella sp. PE36]